ncbi:MAG: hypothetical protein FWD92_04480 [Methanomassiliicoccaceae archaeon]|nr:hypothetical protein [Methanomassiliicoccaceae archaeon]
MKSEAQVIGKVRSQDLSVSWVSESGQRDINTDRVCILMMANGQVRLTMQSSTINLKGMRLTRGHVCIFSLFEGNGRNEADAADMASELFMNSVMRYDITKKPAKDILKKCLSKVDKKVVKKFGDASYKASVAAFAAKDMTACTVNGGRLFVISENGKISELTSAGTEISHIGTSWKNVMMASGGYPVVTEKIKDDLNSPITEIVSKKELTMLPRSSSIIRVHRL